MSDFKTEVLPELRMHRLFKIQAVSNQILQSEWKVDFLGDQGLVHSKNYHPKEENVEPDH